MIELKKLSTGYSKDKVILSNFSHTFQDNAIYAIMGKSGCGKTTLLKTISGLLKPISGSVFVDGKEVKDTGRKIYMMNQRYTSFDWLTCLDNILIIDKVDGVKSNKERIAHALSLLDSVGLAGYENTYPSRLSGGQKQRLALARAMFAESQYILMDEPLSALDEITRRSLQTQLCDFQKEHKNTIIMVTHSEEEAYRMTSNILRLK